MHNIGDHAFNVKIIFRIYLLLNQGHNYIERL